MEEQIKESKLELDELNLELETTKKAIENCKDKDLKQHLISEQSAIELDIVEISSEIKAMEELLEKSKNQ